MKIRNSVKTLLLSTLCATFSIDLWITFTKVILSQWWSEWLLFNDKWAFFSSNNMSILEIYLQTFLWRENMYFVKNIHTFLHVVHWTCCCKGFNPLRNVDFVVMKWRKKRPLSEQFQYPIDKEHFQYTINILVSSDYVLLISHYFPCTIITQRFFKYFSMIIAHI
jgi:hypothetical protein